MDRWPLRTYLELGALPSAVPCARLHARQVVWEWGIQAMSDPVELIVSELVTNSVRASEALAGCRLDGHWMPGVPPVRMWLWSDGKIVLVQVWDGDDRMPQRKDAGVDCEGGRGLMLVEAVSAEWGAYPPEWGSGKVTWAVVTQAG